MKKIRQNIIEKKIDDVILRAKKKKDGDLQKSDYAKYICILVSGYLEKSITIKLMEYSEARSNKKISRFVENKIRRSTNLTSNKIIELLKMFDDSWGDNIYKKLDSKKRDHIDSLINLRNNIAHGGDSGIALNHIIDIYDTVKQVLVDVYDTIGQF